jgi:hypothetical protein
VHELSSDRNRQAMFTRHCVICPDKVISGGSVSPLCSML